MRYFFRKNQRLHKDVDIAPLFAEGGHTFCYPLKVLYRVVPLNEGDTAHSRVVIVVAKRHLKKAHARNLVRRRLREAYRLNAQRIVPKDGFQVHIAFVYVARDICSYTELEKSVVVAFSTIDKKISRVDPHT